MPGKWHVNTGKEKFRRIRIVHVPIAYARCSRMAVSSARLCTRGYFLRSFIHANEYFNLDYDERLMRHGLASGSKLKFDVKFLLSNYTRPIKFTVLIMDSLWIIRLRIFRACGYINGSRGRFSERRRDYKFYLTYVYILRFKFIFIILIEISRV